uniref:VTT domain-containing protein n=1 Tax=Chromera velia CCMP2878 TaxID=1169474 RepID=A0A0G4HMH8_9ALVE|eukprot:Cvel_29139.t1-p1 / transcript=Cvel_29139.t1 / gene=Cvel_29139 / organism=Chromera_velia_CCMP2878 / gene_product=Transmembrane protein 64, putative / transcript_product=Transmembrane protein 64, putative / location=Cvel_scaffold3937:3461-6777(+) / protein_length=422 / sequence_SO=supercontig / SO=protein_coding / is_pseudo=false
MSTVCTESKRGGGEQPSNDGKGGSEDANATASSSSLLQSLLGGNKTGSKGIGVYGYFLTAVLFAVVSYKGGNTIKWFLGQLPQIQATVPNGFLLLGFLTVAVLLGLPCTLIEIGAGFVFGWWGLPISVAGICAGSLTVFAVIRSPLFASLRAQINGQKQVQILVRAVKRQELKFLFLGRLATVPICVKNFFFAVLPVSFPNYLLALFVSAWVSCPAWVYTGISTRSLVEELGEGFFDFAPEGEGESRGAGGEDFVQGEGRRVWTNEERAAAISDVIRRISEKGGALKIVALIGAGVIFLVLGHLAMYEFKAMTAEAEEEGRAAAGGGNEKETERVDKGKGGQSELLVVTPSTVHSGELSPSSSSSSSSSSSAPTASSSKNAGGTSSSSSASFAESTAVESDWPSDSPEPRHRLPEARKIVTE